MKKHYPNIDPYNLPDHYFNASASMHKGSNQFEWLQVFAESENELYAHIEAFPEDWDNNPMVREIRCIEVINKVVVRVWTLNKI